MSFETRFTEEEQVLLSSMPTLIGSTMAFAEGSGIGGIKEMVASAKGVMNGANDFAGNEIIMGILPNVNNRDEAMDKAREMRSHLKEKMNSYQARSRAELREQVMNDLQKVNELLAAKASPQEATEYKTWVLNIAESVAKSAKEGDILGFGGKQISEKETELFAAIAKTLQVDRNMA
jgi:hypothetical protein